MGCARCGCEDPDSGSDSGSDSRSDCSAGADCDGYGIFFGDGADCYGYGLDYFGFGIFFGDTDAAAYPREVAVSLDAAASSHEVSVAFAA